MSIEEEEPLTLPDEPRFHVIADNELSILERLLNPDCQSMARMIDYMSTTWRVYGRVRGIWIRIRHIPLVYFTIDTMYALAKEIGKVEEIAYDPKVSQTKDYIRARITFNVDNPAKVTRKLNVESSDPVTIEFEYEKIHKRCFHCFRLTHEKIRCPHLRKGFFKEKPHTLETQLLRGAKNLF